VRDGQLRIGIPGQRQRFVNAAPDAGEKSDGCRMCRTDPLLALDMECLLGFTGLDRPHRSINGGAGGPNQQDRLGGGAQDRLGHAAENESADAASPMAGHHDEVHLPPVSRLHDAGRRRSVSD